MQKCDISSSTQKIKWCTQECVPPYGSDWTACATNRETVLRKPQVLPAADGPPKVSESTKETSFCITLLITTLVRESTSQEIIALQFCY
jgi:hypothetical protein